MRRPRSEYTLKKKKQEIIMRMHNEMIKVWTKKKTQKK